MSLGPMEIILIIVVVALLFGARKLPELMKGMGQGVREFKNEVKDPVAPPPPLVADDAHLLPQPVEASLPGQHERR